jgi:hypothetical protein
MDNSEEFEVMVLKTPQAAGSWYKDYVGLVFTVVDTDAKSPYYTVIEPPCEPRQCLNGTITTEAFPKYLLVKTDCGKA